ncbi:MAG: hypothetical protein RL220_1295 [Bacteroidota bacterium]
MKYSVQGYEFSKSDLELWCWNRLPEVEPWERSHLMVILQWLGPGSVMEVRTSGSTGEPRTMELSKEMMTHSARTTASVLGLPAASRVLLCLPSEYIAGKMMIIRALVNRWQLTWIKPSEDPFAGIRQTFDLTALTPVQTLACLASEDSMFHRLKCCLIGGQRISGPLTAALQSSKVRCIETYGMTETASHIALREINGPSQSDFFAPLPGVSLSLDDRSCLVIDAPRWNLHNLITNDVVESGQGGGFRFVGRADFVINSGGIKIHPEQLERKVRHLIQGRYFVMGIPDDKRGEKVALFIESEEPESIDVLKLISAFREELNPFERPRFISIVPKIDHTATYKLKRRFYEGGVITEPDYSVK